MNTLDNLTNSERQYAEAVKQSMKDGRISGVFRMALIKKGRELAIAPDRCSEIEKKLLAESATEAPKSSPSSPMDVERDERKRLAELERKQEEARREAQRLDEVRRRAEDSAKKEREMAEQARVRRETEERKDRERREAEHKRQMQEQARIHKEAEKAAAMKVDAERAKREAAEAKAAAELARKDAELKVQQAKMEARIASEVSQRNNAEQKSSRKRWLFLLLGILFGWLGVHLAYARRWILFGILWAALIGFFSNCGTTEKPTDASGQTTSAESQPTKQTGGNDAIAIPCFLTFAALWLGGALFIKKDGKRKLMKWL
ncbi:MAG: hypothetical protein IKU71_07535 [Kiritimatiellae bacterium]|nr:hypothetical protein [Kiritimatiellia bacterium]